jgi:hypothetical protein
MPTLRFVCDPCQAYQYGNYHNGEPPKCNKCRRPMREPNAAPRIERPHDDYNRDGSFFSVDPLRRELFARLMRRAFENEAGIAGYREV